MAIDITKGDLKFFAYAVGLASASACTNLPDADAVNRMNREYPTGTPAPWALATDKTFADGTPHPCPCTHPDRRETHRHVLFHC